MVKVLSPGDIGLGRGQHNDYSSELDISGSRAWLDFVEIGTSNFNTLTHVAAERAMHGVRLAGIAMEAVGFYLDELPLSPGVKKVKAAITDDPHKQAAAVYYMPPSLLRGRTGDILYEYATSMFPRYVGGMGSVDQLLPPITHYRGQEFVMAAWFSLREFQYIQRMFVPSYDVAAFMREHAAGSSIKLLKLDLEVTWAWMNCLLCYRID